MAPRPPRYKVGAYSGQERLDTTNLEEPDKNDGPDARQAWFEDERNEPTFKKFISSRIDYFNSILGPGRHMKDLDVIAIGHSHIDVCWLWRYEQTRKKAMVTFNKACEMGEKWYPGKYTFHQSQPQLFEWVEHDFPELFERIKAQVKAGSFNIVGGSWVEPDNIMPSGEAFVRQRLYGMYYFKEKFGIMPDIEWMMDSFGYGRNLPQIFTKSGAKYFWTTKITWNRCTTFPFVNFWWQAPDGSRILCHESHQGFGTIEKFNLFEIGRYPLEPGKTYVGDYTRDYDDIADYVNIDKLNTTIGLWYGMGDGGHGPTSQEVAEMMEYQAQGALHVGTAREFFDKLSKGSENYPAWNDELYLEYHRGTLTTHSRVKRNNRRLECKAGAVEMLCAFATTLASAPFPSELLDTTWKTILKNQFHDCLPGSSIPEAYDEVIEDWEYCDEWLDQATSIATESIKVDTGKVLVFNPNVDAGLVRAFIPISAVPECPLDDHHLPKQGIAKVGDVIAPLQPASAEPEDWIEARSAGWWTVLPLAGIAANQIEVDFNDEETITKHFGKAVDVSASDDGPFLESDVLRVELDKSTGHVTKATSSLLPAVANIFAGPSNVPMAFLDNFPNDQAWNILNTRTPEYNDKQRPYKQDENVRITISARGPVVSELTIEKTFGPQIILQKIALFKGLPEIYCEFHVVDWKEPPTLVKISFDTATEAETVESDGQYCIMARKAAPETPADRARWEKNQHRFSDMVAKDGTWGIAFINNGKYGFDTLVPNVYRLTVLKCANYPNPATESWAHAERKMNLEKHGRKQPQYTDIGLHRTFYAIFPHPGSTRSAPGGQPATMVTRRADAFNFPLVVAGSNPAGKGTLPVTSSLVQATNPAVVVKAVKQGHVESSLLVIRLVEYTGNDASTDVVVHGSIAARVVDAREGDLLERPTGGAISWDKTTGRIPVKLGKWEIKTLLLRLD